MPTQTLHICHITVLNPLGHTRIYHKLARAQADLGYKVSILGQGEIPQNPDPRIGFFSTGNFHRLSLKRLFFRWLLGKILNQIQADVYILHAPELLSLGKKLHKEGKKVLYDVHEDYFTTLSHANHYPRLLRKYLARSIRKKEKQAMLWLDGVSYAEELYDNMLEVEEGKKVVLRNSFSAIINLAKDVPARPSPYLLYSGTIAKHWGICEAMELWKEIRLKQPYDMVVAGFSYDQKLLDEIILWVNKNELTDHFHLIGGSNYVPYEDILFYLKNCSASFALYHLQPHIQGKVPTKFYEAMAFGKPLIFTKAPFWEALNKKHSIGIPYEPGMSIPALLSSIEQWAIHLDPDTYSWEVDAKRMETWLKHVLP